MYSDSKTYSYERKIGLLIAKHLSLSTTGFKNFRAKVCG